MAEATTYPVVIGGSLEIDGDPAGNVVISPVPTSVVCDAKVDGKSIYTSIIFIATTGDGYVTPPTVLSGNSVDVKADSMSIVLDSASVSVTATLASSGATKVISVKVSDAGQDKVKIS